MKVADMTVDELAELIRTIVAEELEALRNDDDGEMRPEFVEELKQALASNEEGVPLAEVLAELQIKA